MKKLVLILSSVVLLVIFIIGLFQIPEVKASIKPVPELNMRIN